MAQLPFAVLQPFGTPSTAGVLRGLTLSQFRANVVPVTTATHTLTSDLTGSVIVYDTANGTNVTIPATLDPGFNCLLVQANSGAVTFTFGSGALNLSSAGGLGAPNTYASLLVTSNPDESSARVLIGQSPIPTTPIDGIPSNTALPSISGVPIVGNALTAGNGVWTNNPTVYAYQWYANNVAISNATASTYTLVVGDVGKSITVRVTATNAAGSTASTSSPTGTVANAGAPANTTLPAITGGTVEGSQLSASTGIWVNTPLSYAYQWRSDNSNIVGATSNTYTLTSNEVGTTVTCVVTATNASGSSSATTDGVGPVTAAGSSPVNTVLPSVSGTPTEGQTITAALGTWTNSPTSYTYQWKNNASDISGATASTYVLQTSDVGDTITVAVTAINASGSTTATSAGFGPIASAGSYATESTTLFAAFTSNPGDTRKGHIDTLIKALKTGATSASDIWAKLDVLHIYAAHDSQASLINWKTPGTFNATVTNTPSFTADRGWTTTDTTTNAIDTNMNPATAVGTVYALNSASFSVWSRTSGQTTNAGIGARSTGGTGNITSFNPRDGSDQISGRINYSTGSAGLTASNTDGSGFFTISRTAGNLFKLYRNGAQLGSNGTTAAIGRPSSNFVLGILPNTSNRVAREFAACAIGSGLTDAEVLDTYNAVQAYMTAVGA